MGAICLGVFDSVLSADCGSVILNVTLFGQMKNGFAMKLGDCYHYMVSVVSRLDDCSLN